MSTKATRDDSKAGLERMTDSVVAQCETGERGYLELATWDTRLFIKYFLWDHETKQKELDFLVGCFTRVIGLMN